MRIGTLFSGIGSPEQAVKRVYDNHKIVFACEFDKFARESYKANYKIDDKHFHVDVNEMDGKQYKDQVDIIIGGSPCQDFSIAGLRAGIDGHKGQLIWQYYRIIKEAMPPIFIYENVKGMVSDKNGKTLSDFLEIFRDLGYYCHSEVLNTKDYGVPQNRERIYIVGFLDSERYYRFEYADKIKLVHRLKDVLEDEVDEKYYLSEEMVNKFVSTGNNTGYINQDTQASSVFSVEKESPTLCAGTHGYAQGYIKVEGMLDIKGTDQIRRVYGVEGVAATLTTMQGGNQEPKIKVKSNTAQGYVEAYMGDNINLSFSTSTTRRGQVGKQVAQTLDCACNQAVVQERIRKLTPRECLRLQDFDDSFKIVVSNSQAYKQAGNSMSANVLEMLFRQIDKTNEKAIDCLF